MKFKFLKKNLFTYSIVFLFLGLFSLIAFTSYAKAKSSGNNSKEIPTIILDPGHGGEDGGAVGVDGIVEKDINLAISLKLQNFLEASGYKVIMTREKDTAIYDDNLKTLREKKRSDLRNRMGIINKSKEEEKTVFVSIHQNKFPDSKYFGTQIFYSVNDSKSENLANKIKDSVTGLLQPENDREIKPATNKIFLLHNAHIPAVIAECGFISNPEEAAKLKSEKYQNQMAFSIYCGIVNYFMEDT